MTDITKMQCLYRVTLRNADHLMLIGMASDQTVFVESEDSENAMINTWRISSSGVLAEHLPVQPISSDLSVPVIPGDHPLNYRGLRWRGLRETDRVQDWVQPLSITEKMPLLAALQIHLPPPLLLGIGESYVLSMASINPSQQMVCRRVRLLYALPQVQHDTDGLPYDYDSKALHLIHPYNTVTDSAPPLHDALATCADAALVQPVDCMIVQQRLVVLDQGDEHYSPQVVCWQLADIE